MRPPRIVRNQRVVRAVGTRHTVQVQLTIEVGLTVGLRGMLGGALRFRRIALRCIHGPGRLRTCAHVRGLVGGTPRRLLKFGYRLLHRAADFQPIPE